jgi:outer membrane receptor for ferrienterochelin and colicins
MPSYSIDSDNQIYKTSIQDFSIADCFISRSIWTNRLKIVLGAKNICNVKNITGNTSGAVHSENENKISVGTGRSYFVKLDLYINSKK